jgi:hypothetical protein
MFDVIVDIDEAIAQELSDWCDFNLDGFMGYVSHGTGHKFYFDTLKEAKAFKIIMQNEEWN